MRSRWFKVLLAVLVPAVLVITACSKPSGPPAASSAGGGQSLTSLSGEANDVIKNRNLKPQDVVAALKTFMPSGEMDEAIMFASSGHGGQVVAIGIPSMRTLKLIGVFTPEPWQGWGFNDETREVLKGGQVGGKDVLWADTHHPALSETNGEYDGEWLFINDKSNGRVALIDLRDWETKQIVKNPLFDNDHGSSFVTPNSEYIFEGSQYATPVAGGYAPLEAYKEKYRGIQTMWKFDRQKGRIDPAQSFSIELPPYWQDLCDAGKGVSEGWVFCNSINTELATGADGKGAPNFEASTAQRDMDYLHVINWKKAEELYKAGKTVDVSGHKVIPLATAAAEGVLFFVPEPKSPHGSDVTPKGDYIVVGGKLDPHASIYSFKKIQDAIQKGGLEKDDFGVPIIPFNDALAAQVELGLGPLHTVFDDKGYAYTSLFLDSAVSRWTLGPEYDPPEGPWKLVTKTNVQYNIGHIAAYEGDTAKPKGKWVVALNKWAIDRFLSTGPLHPQNLQLLDASKPGTTLPVVYDMPVGYGEPHYAQIIDAKKLKSWNVYPEIGWDPITQAKHPKATMIGQEKVIRNGNNVEIFMTAIRSHFTPERIELKKGDNVTWHITNVERARDATHGFAIPGLNINLSLEPGETNTFTFTADRSGVFAWYCTEFCSALHLEMAGYMLVEP